MPLFRQLIVTAKCDHPGCGEEVDAMTSQFKLATLGLLEAAWNVIGDGRCFCPKHSNTKSNRNVPGVEKILARYDRC